MCCEKVLEGVQLHRDTSLGEAGHTKIAHRLSIMCQNQPFGTKIGLGSCLIFITSNQNNWHTLRFHSMTIDNLGTH